MSDERPKEPVYQAPLELTPEQIEFIKPLLERERPKTGEVNMILAQVRSAPYPNKGKVELAFCLVDYRTAGKILKTIEESKATRYAPSGSRANFVELLPTGKPIFVTKDKTKRPTVK